MDWISSNITLFDYFWFICASICLIVGNGSNELSLINSDILEEIKKELEKKRK